MNGFLEKVGTAGTLLLIVLAMIAVAAEICR